MKKQDLKGAKNNGKLKRVKKTENPFQIRSKFDKKYERE